MQLLCGWCLKKMKQIKILGIETSCDETSAAVVVNGSHELSNVVASQIETHKRYGGVVPEIASRQHMDAIIPVIEEALQKAEIGLDELDAIAVTKGPGLVGALLVGIAAAKSIAYAKGIPLIGVHHIAGHICANQLIGELQAPYLSLIVSGGHTELVLVAEQGRYEILGQTLDDAVGEAYDKVARTLGLPYPGGPQIDRLARQGKVTIDFPRARLEQGSLDFSFSGLKSAVLNYLNQAAQKKQTPEPADVAASFQQAVVDVLVEKTTEAMRRTHLSRLVVAGGVAANSGLREALQQQAEREGWELHVPPINYCTDNAAMIAAAAYPLYLKQEFADLSLNATASLSL